MESLNFKMENEEADSVISDILHNVSETMLVKAKEYARGDDRLHNFNKASLLSGKTREECLNGFRLKHIISSKDIINDINNNQDIPSIDLVNEKYTDIINYYILEYMSVVNKINNLTNNKK